MVILRTAGLAGLAAVALLVAACSTSSGDSAGTPEPADTSPKVKSAKPAVARPFENQGFTIRYLDQGKIKKIDVPDFEH